MDIHAGRVARIVVQALVKRRLLHTRLLDVDIMIRTKTIEERYNDCLKSMMRKEQCTKLVVTAMSAVAGKSSSLSQKGKCQARYR
jgi:hypothetical protein